MSRIATLTMNPAIDVSTSTAKVEPERKLRCAEGRRDPGGGGINVARVASRLGAEVVAVFPIGGFTGRLLESLVVAEGVSSHPIEVSGETREDFTVFDEAGDTQYRFVLPGPHLDAAKWLACVDAIIHLDPRPDLFCASGSLPPGAPEDTYARLAALMADWGVPLALDASGPGLARALERGVHLIKPNLREMRELTGMPLEDAAGRVAACRILIGRGAAQIVALSMGAAGAMLVTADHAWQAAALPIHAVSTVGAGDSFLGAMCWALAGGRALDDAFRWGVAGGSATVLAHGTALCDPADVRRLYAQVTIQALSA
jgi:6-phosphofructokinase 2